MKKIILFLCLALGSFISAQRYEFDYLIITEEKSEKSEEPQVYYLKKAINSHENFIELYINENGVSSIFDSKNNLRHYFEMKLDQKNNLQFNYLYSHQLQQETETFIEVKKINDQIYVVQNFKNNKRNKIETEITVTLEEAPNNLINFTADIGGFQRKEFANKLKEALNNSKTYIIKESKIKYNRTDNKFTSKLNSYTKISPLVIETPKKLIFKDK